MAFIGPAVAAASTVYGALKKGHADRDMAAAIARYRGATPRGSLDPGDYAQAGRIRSAYARYGRDKRGQGDASTIARARQMGLDAAAPGLVNRSLARNAEEAGAIGVQGVGAGEDFLASTLRGREQWEQHRLDRLLDADLGLASDTRGRADAERAGLYNSVQQFLPTISQFWKNGGTGGATGGALRMGQPGFVYPVGGAASSVSAATRPAARRGYGPEQG